MIVGPVQLVVNTQWWGPSPRPGGPGGAALLLDEVTVLAAGVIRSGQFVSPHMPTAILAAVGRGRAPAAHGTSPATRASPRDRPLPHRSQPCSHPPLPALPAIPAPGLAAQVVGDRPRNVTASSSCPAGRRFTPTNLGLDFLADRAAGGRVRSRVRVSWQPWRQGKEAKTRPRKLTLRAQIDPKGVIMRWREDLMSGF